MIRGPCSYSSLPLRSLDRCYDPSMKVVDSNLEMASATDMKFEPVPVSVLMVAFNVVRVRADRPSSCCLVVTVVGNMEKEVDIRTLEECKTMEDNMIKHLVVLVGMMADEKCCS